MILEPSLPVDAGRHFEELVAALEERRSPFTDVASLRIAAATALTIPGSPYDVAAAIDRTAAEIHRQVPWYQTHRGSVRFFLAALLVPEEDTVSGFLEEVERGQRLFRDHGLRRGSIFEILAILLLRMHRQRRPIPETDVVRFRQIYEEMKRHHWWFTGPDDYPACALLVACSGDPAHLGRQMEDIHRGLLAGGAKGSDPLQTASHLLALDEHRSVTERVESFHRLCQAFVDAGERLDERSRDDLAALALLTAPPETVARLTIEHQRGIARRWPMTPATFSFAIGAALTFLDLARNAGGRPHSGPLQDLRTLLRHQHLATAVTLASALAAARAG